MTEGTSPNEPLVTEVVNFGDLKVGDQVLHPLGFPTTVTQAYDTHIPDSMYELEMENGQIIRASGNHLWYIEPLVDRNGHRRRIKEAAKLLKKLDPVVIEGLEGLAKEEAPYEVTLPEVLEILESLGNLERVQKFASRVVASVGPVAESHVLYQDPGSGDEIAAPPVRLYDGRRVAKQILALTGKKKYKSWEVIVGRVATTTEIALYYPDADIAEASL